MEYVRLHGGEGEPRFIFSKISYGKNVMYTSTNHKYVMREKKLRKEEVKDALLNYLTNKFT
jgi:hypothetical protein